MCLYFKIVVKKWRRSGQYYMNWKGERQGNDNTLGGFKIVSSFATVWNNLCCLQEHQQGSIAPEEGQMGALGQVFTGRVQSLLLGKYLWESYLGT